jgi:cellulose synthase/poly-beta-1,6-N-acetylglucosamine synthase-like glycosyltransferase
MPASLIFWASALLLGYAYLGYPSLIRAWASLRPRPAVRSRRQPTVSVVVVVHNEAARISDRLENLLALDYPRERLEILLGSDGSTDATVERAQACAAAGIRVVALEPRRGKAAVLNHLVPRARGEIVVLADARQTFDSEAVRELVAPFGDPRVGAVSGVLILRRDEGGSAVGEGVGFYRRYETSIRRSESLVDSTVGATGAIYAIRRSLFEPIPDDTILDDVLIPMRIVRHGYRTILAPGARAYDRPAASAREEWIRKVRTIAGNFQLLARERWLLDPLRNRLWLQTVSHKGLRLLGPLLLAAALAANLLMADRPFYRWVLLAHLAFYTSAALGGTLPRAASRIPGLTLPYLVCLLNWATVVAFFRFVTGRQRVTWKRASA